MIRREQFIHIHQPPLHIQSTYLHDIGTNLRRPLERRKRVVWVGYVPVAPVGNRHRAVTRALLPTCAVARDSCTPRSGVPNHIK